MSKLFISGFPADTTERQIEDLFIKEGRIVFSDINISKGSGYLEYDDPKNAQKAIESLNGSTQFGSKITVELPNQEPQRAPHNFKQSSHFKKFRGDSYSRSRSKSSSRSYSRGRRHSRNYRLIDQQFQQLFEITRTYSNQQQQKSRKMPTSRDKCYVCGKYGHWASQCKEGDGSGVSSGKCFKCGERGHIARKCPNQRKRSMNSFSKSGSRSNSRSYSSERSRRKRRSSPSQSSRSNNSSRQSSQSSDRSKKNHKRHK